MRRTSRRSGTTGCRGDSREMVSRRLETLVAALRLIPFFRER